MRVLAIESSCDETAVAVIEGEGENVRAVASFVRSQIDIHQAYGGVVPEVAAREHLEYLFPMLKEAGVSKDSIDVIAVTAGPGLAPALRVGVEAGKTLAWAWGKPLVPVCHLEGHIYASWLLETPDFRLQTPDTRFQTPDSRHQIPEFPALALIVSGGHTELVLMKAHGEFVRLGETIDDAAGEAFDKVAKMLGLPYPGGPEVEKLAVNGNPTVFDFPRAMLDARHSPIYGGGGGGLDFSFAGVKTSVLYTLRKHEDELCKTQFRADIAASFQEAVVDVLCRKTAKAISGHNPASVILAGGVAANKALRTRLQELGTTLGVPVFVPPFKYSLDNAAMIGVAGYFRARAGQFANPMQVVANPNMDIV